MNEAVLLVPAGVGVFITFLVGLGKYFGVVKDDMGGKVSLAANLIAGFVILFLGDVVEVNTGSELAKNLYEFLGAAGALGLSFLSSFVTHSLSKSAMFYKQPLRER